MNSSQCRGVTTKGQRCKIAVSNVTYYCHYHTNQDPAIHQLAQPIKYINSARRKGHITQGHQKGFIYVYTLEHLLSESPKKQDWLQVKKFSNTESDTNWKVFNPKKYILIKVGLTTGTVAQRLKQWETKCNHAVTYVDPYSTQDTRSLSSLFSKLSISKTKSTGLKNYDPVNHGFYASKNLGDIERTIHKTLWSLYGRGDIICHGCKSGGAHSIHIEWFKVKRENLKTVFRLIDEICEHHKSRS